MADKDLKELAELVYSLARREVWLGGEGSSNWPKDVHDTSGRPPSWNTHTTWTLSPEVELGGNRLRVCVVSISSAWHEVYVYVDGGLKYPGGKYKQGVRSWLAYWLWGERWSTRLARIERADGGQAGHVERRDLLIEEARRILTAPEIEHEEEPSPAELAARAEVEALMQRTARATEGGSR